MAMPSYIADLANEIPADSHPGRVGAEGHAPQVLRASFLPTRRDTLPSAQADAGSAASGAPSAFCSPISNHAGEECGGKVVIGASASGVHVNLINQGCAQDHGGRFYNGK